jgi:hypothetical protein
MPSNPFRNSENGLHALVESLRLTGTYQEEVKTSCRQPAELRKQVRTFRESIRNRWRQQVPTARAREPYDNEVLKYWTAEITKTTDVFKRLTQRDLSLTGGCDPYV